jgi:Phage major capsid protein E
MASGKVYVDQALTQISQKWTNDDDSFIAEKLFPVVNVDNETGIYWEFGKENLKKPVSTLRTGRSKTPESSFSRIQRNYGPLQEHDLKDFILWKERDQAKSPIDVEGDLVAHLNEQMAIEREVALATTLSDTGIVTRNVNLGSTPTAQWNDYANSNPFANITTGITDMRKYGLKAPNTIFMGWDVWAQLMHHPDFLERIKYNSLGVVTKEMVGSLFSDQGIQNVYVGSSVYDSAAEGLTATNGFAWGKHFWLSYVGAPNLRTVNGGFTLVLNGGRYVDRWSESDEKCDYIRTNDFYEQKLVGADVFYLIKNAVA